MFDGEPSGRGGGVAAERTAALWRVALVDDDDGLGSRRLGVDRLLGEEAGAALGEGDVVVARPVDAGKVGGFTAAR